MTRPKSFTRQVKRFRKIICHIKWKRAKKNNTENALTVIGLRGRTNATYGSRLTVEHRTLQVWQKMLRDAKIPPVPVSFVVFTKFKPNIFVGENKQLNLGNSYVSHCTNIGARAPTYLLSSLWSTCPGLLDARSRCSFSILYLTSLTFLHNSTVVSMLMNPSRENRKCIMAKCME